MSILGLSFESTLKFLRIPQNKYTFYKKRSGRLQKYFDDKINKRFHLKLFTSILFICLLVMFNTLFIRAFSYEIKCFDDKLFVATTPIYEYLKFNETILDFTLILGGVLEDIAITTGFVLFSLKFDTWRMIIALGSLYAVRGQLQQAYYMEFPEEYIFRFPGVYSLSVPYLKTNDFFFSGHVSLPVIVAVEFYKQKYIKLSCFCFFVSIYEGFMMIIVRGHYSIDIYAGFIIALYFSRISEYIAPFVDRIINGDSWHEYRKIENKEAVKVNVSVNVNKNKLE